MANVVFVFRKRKCGCCVGVVMKELDILAQPLIEQAIYDGLLITPITAIELSRVVKEHAFMNCNHAEIEPSEIEVRRWYLNHLQRVGLVQNYLDTAYSSMLEEYNRQHNPIKYNARR